MIMSLILILPALKIGASPLTCEEIAPGIQKCKDETRICYITDTTDKVGISCIAAKSDPIEQAKKR